jgi:hypothetical protein
VPVPHDGRREPAVLGLVVVQGQGNLFQILCGPGPVRGVANSSGHGQYEEGEARPDHRQADSPSD